VARYGNWTLDDMSAVASHLNEALPPDAGSPTFPSLGVAFRGWFVDGIPFVVPATGTTLVAFGRVALPFATPEPSYSPCSAPRRRGEMLIEVFLQGSGDRRIQGPITNAAFDTFLPQANPFLMVSLASPLFLGETGDPISNYTATATRVPYVSTFNPDL
jgi:hypothetical protein